MSGVLFTIFAIISALLLFTASITSTLAAGDCYGSSFYDTDPKVRSAHQYLTIAAALGWSSFVILLVVLLVATFAGGFTTTEVSDALLTKTSPNKSDLMAAYRGEKELSAGHTTQIVVIVVLIIVSIVTLIVGILSVVAAMDLSGAKQKDSKISSAYTYSIVAAVSGVGGVIVMFIALMAYLGIRSLRKKQLQDLEDFQKKTEEKLGIKEKSSEIEMTKM